MRIALSQLDASKRDLNDSASWIISDFFDKVRVAAWLNQLMNRLLPLPLDCMRPERFRPRSSSANASAMCATWVGALLCLAPGCISPRARPPRREQSAVDVTHAPTATGCIPSLTASLPFGSINCLLQADLKSALTATDYIPCFTGDTVYTLFRNNPVIDGGCLPCLVCLWWGVVLNRAPELS